MPTTQTVYLRNPPSVVNIQTQSQGLSSSLTSQTVKASKVFVGGVQIIKPPNKL
jgi:hypothetical protein